MRATGFPTPHPDANAVLERLGDEVRAVLGDAMVGLYLYGSLSTGGYDPASSDIDFLVATDGELTAAQLDALKAMHDRIASSGLPQADHLEGSYISVAALPRYDPARPDHPTIGPHGDWPFGIGHHGPEWAIQRHVVRECGVVVCGPDPATLIDPVTPDELRAAARASLRSWDGIEDRERMAEEHGAGAFWGRRAYQAFAALTMCRILYTIEHGAIATKMAAAAWARERFPEWAPIIDRAFVWRDDMRPDDLAETLAFVRWVMGEMNHRGTEAQQGRMLKQHKRELKHDLKRQVTELRALVWEWDPVGLAAMGVPEDEYDCVVSPLLGRLHRAGSAEEVASFLEEFLPEHFGLSPGGAKQFSERAVAWLRDRQPPTGGGNEGTENRTNRLNAGGEERL